MQTFKPFDHHVCVGDTRRVDVGPLTIVATIELDETTTPHDFDGGEGAFYLDEWQRGEWFYVGVVLSVYCGGVCLTDNAAALWSIEANYPESDNSYLTDVASELLPEAIQHGQAILEKLRSAATEVHL